LLQIINVDNFHTAEYILRHSTIFAYVRTDHYRSRLCRISSYIWNKQIHKKTNFLI